MSTDANPLSATGGTGTTPRPPRVRVAAVDDHQMVLDGLASHLASVPDLTLVATASTVAELLASGQSIDVVVLDLQLADRSDPADNVARLIAAGYRVLVVSAHTDCDLVIATTSAGADGYLAKTHGMATLVAALREVAAGGTAYSPELAHCWQRDRRPERPALSAQETRVLVAYAHGAKLTTAARIAGIKPGTAKVYLDRIKAKYRQANRPVQTKYDLAQRVREDGLNWH